MKKRMEWRLLCSVVLALGVSGWGCSSSSDDPSIDGQGPEGVSKALVCLDTNDNYDCDSGEPATRSGADGSYSLPVSSEKAAGHRVLLLVDDQTVDAATGAHLPSRYTMASLKGQPELISVFTTLLEDSSDEEALRATLDIDGDAGLFEPHAEESSLAVFGTYLDRIYSGIYDAAAKDPEATPADTFARVKGRVLELIIEKSDVLLSHINQPPSPPLLTSPPQSTRVSEEIFQNIPVDAGTMSLGSGMNEITREVVSGAYCLDIPQSELVPELAISENSRNYLFRLIRSEKDLKSLLNVGGGISLGTTLVEGSLEGRFINEYRNSSDAIFALIKAEYILNGYHSAGVSLDETYLTEDSTRASYVSNYDDFRKACGDRFLQQITTGGAYYGLLRITTKDNTSKQDLQAQLDGKYGKAGISVSVEGDLKSTVKESLKNTNIEITVGSRGVSPEYLGLTDPEDQLVDNLDDFFDAANQFMGAISGGDTDCFDDDIGWKKCAYTATFADYATVSGGIPRNRTQAQNLAFTTKLMGQYEDYLILDKMIDDILLNEPDYDWTRRDITSGDVFYQQWDLEDGLLILDSAFRKCTNDFEGCTDNPEAANLDGFNRVVMNLPRLKREYPQDCRDVQRIYGTEEDREGVTVYLSGDANKPFKVSCTNMDTSEPATYLDLPNTSGSTDSLSYNMARNVNSDGSEVSSIYKKIRINVNYNSIEIINDQPGQAETSTTAADDSPTADENFAQARLGSAVDCYATEGGAISNIDLTGTNFIFDDGLTYVTDVHPSSKYEWVNEVKTWDEASAYAQSQGGSLVVIDDPSEWERVVNWLEEDPIRDQYSWIGLKRTDLAQPAQYQQFQWVGTGENLTSREQRDYFYPGEPNNYGGKEGCVHFHHKNANHKLNDWFCGKTAPFAIEYDLTAPDGEAVFNEERTTVDLSVSGEAPGTCTELRPSSGVIRLQYAP